MSPLIPPFRSRYASRSPYAPVTATSPDLFVPLKYASTSADGQILYQDAACTVPVTTIGDPVGGVKFRGTILATQSTDANRPVWQGEDVGVEFTRASEHHLVASAGSFLSGDAAVTVVASLTPDSYGAGANEGYVWGIGEETDSHTTDRRVAGLALETATETAVRLFGGNAVYDALPLSEHVATIRYQGGGVAWEVFEDGSAKTLQSSSTGVMNFTSDRVLIGADPVLGNSDRPSGASTYDGKMKAWAIYDGALTGADKTDAENAMAAL